MTPRAVFVFWWDLPQIGPTPFYNITDPLNHKDGSTVTAETLKEEGIDVPKTPAFEEWSLSQIK